MKYLHLLVLVLIILAMSSCNAEELPAEEKIITVSILPQKYFAGTIAGEGYTINVMVPPGASPETYEPTPRQITQLEKSDIYFMMGRLDFELIWMEKFRRNSPGLAIADMSFGIPYLSMNYKHGDHYHKGSDPHTWMSTSNAMKISQNTLNALLRIYPEDSLIFRENYAQLVDEIREVETRYAEYRDKLDGLHFLIYHPALTYLAKDFNMQQHVLEFEGKSPPPAHLMKLIKTGQEHNIRVIFIQKEFNRENAQSLAKEISAEIIPIDPLNENWPEEMLSILSHLVKIAS